MAHLFTTQFPWTKSATCWMHLSTEVESVPEASRPIRLANWITLTAEKREHNGGHLKNAQEERSRTAPDASTVTGSFILRYVRESYHNRLRQKQMMCVCSQMCDPTILHQSLDLVHQRQRAELGHGKHVTGTDRLHTNHTKTSWNKKSCTV